MDDPRETNRLEGFEEFGVLNVSNVINVNSNASLQDATRILSFVFIFVYFYAKAIFRRSSGSSK